MNYRLMIIQFLTLSIFLTGCVTNDTNTNVLVKSENEMMDKPNDPLPLMSLSYEGSIYKFNKIIPKEEIDMNQIVYTGTYTKFGEPVLNGKEILFYKKNKSVFIIDNNGPKEEWANFTEFDK